MSRFFLFFEIPSQAVEMQYNFNEELEKANRGRYNLWAVGVLTHLLPVSILVPTPNHEVFFSKASCGERCRAWSLENKVCHWPPWQ
jgi:hypothetical protein